MTPRSCIAIGSLAALLSAAAPARAETPAATDAAPLADAPTTGVDADVEALLADAAAALRTPGGLERAVDLALTLELSEDPYARAQRSRVRDRVQALLLEAGTQASKEGNLPVAARALDARWQLGGRPADPAYADVLQRWAAERAATDKGEALYLARRARVASPDNRAAADLDHSLSRNHLTPIGYGLMVVAAVAAGAGLWALHSASSAEEELSASIHSRAEVDDLIARRDRNHSIGVGALIAAPALFLGGSLTIHWGNPKHSPVSPRELPALSVEAQ